MNFLISRYDDALSACEIRFKIHIKLYAVVYTVVAQMCCHIAQSALALNAEWKTHFPSTPTGFFIPRFVERRKSLKRHRKKCYLIWEMWDKLNFYYNEVFHSSCSLVSLPSLFQYFNNERGTGGIENDFSRKKLLLNFSLRNFKAWKVHQRCFKVVFEWHCGILKF